MSEEFKNRLMIHAKTAVDRAGRAQNEEATKQFLIMPFFTLLGYDPNDPDEVFPEADASFSDKFKNRVDYAIYREGDPVIAVEAKKVGTLLTANRGELKGYYNAVPTVKLGILTDGLSYQLYSDTEAENFMDDAPFAVIDLEQIAQENIGEEAFDALLKIRGATGYARRKAQRPAAFLNNKKAKHSDKKRLLEFWLSNHVMPTFDARPSASLVREP